MNRIYAREPLLNRPADFPPVQLDEKLLRSENARLKELVVQLTTIILKNIERT